jgi:hypothetical protein
MRNVVKYTVPISLPGSPSWHRKQLNDLLFLVQEWGMPHLFLTLTADEASEMRWTEVNDLEAHLNKFCSSFTWEVSIYFANYIHSRDTTLHTLYIYLYAALFINTKPYDILYTYTVSCTLHYLRIAH